MDGKGIDSNDLAVVTVRCLHANIKPFLVYTTAVMEKILTKVLCGPLMLR